MRWPDAARRAGLRRGQTGGEHGAVERILLLRHLLELLEHLGRIVELADGKDIYRDPLMPYTKALISAVPVPDPLIEAKRERIILKGDVPSPINPPAGCHFHTRCAYAIDDCRVVTPRLVEIKPRHFAACIRIDREHPSIEENSSAGLGSFPQPAHVAEQSSSRL